MKDLKILKIKNNLQESLRSQSVVLNFAFNESIIGEIDLQYG